MEQVTTIALCGAKGRMGQRIAACAEGLASIAISARLDRGDVPPILSQPSLPSMLASVQVVVDFSCDQGSREALELARRLRSGLLVGTTGLSSDTRDALDRAAEEIPVLVAANTSLGVAVTRRLVEEAARLLGAEYDVDIVETHHTKKLDAPSGTALALATSLETGGRRIAPERIHALRCGDVVGDHVVQFAGLGEILSIRHTATNRDLFALGALRAARWLAGRAPGRYRIDDTF